MKKFSFKVLLAMVSVLLLCAGYALADGPSYKYDSIVMTEGTREPFTMMACEIDGVSWWDECRGKFYFDREHYNIATGVELNALHATLPSGELKKVRNNSLLKSFKFSTYNCREFNYKDSKCFLTYGVRLHVEIPAKGGTKKFDLTDCDN